MSGYEKEHVSIHLDTKFRQRGSIEEATWYLDSAVKFSNDPRKSYRVRLENTLMPKSQYEINSSNNTFILLEDDGGSGDEITITIDEGNYTINELIALLESELDTATLNTNDYVIEYDDTTNKITFYFTGTSSQITIYSIANGSTLNEVLGIGKADTDFITGQDNSPVVLAGAGNALVASYAVDLSTIDYVIIETNITSDNHYDHQVQKNIGVEIPMNVDRNTIKSFENHMGFKSKITNLHSLQKIELRLLDKNGNVVDNNGVDYSTNVVIYELVETWKV